MEEISLSRTVLKSYQTNSETKWEHYGPYHDLRVVLSRFFGNSPTWLQVTLICRHSSSGILGRNRLCKCWKVVQGQCSWGFQDSTGKSNLYLIFHLSPAYQKKQRANANMQIIQTQATMHKLLTLSKASLSDFLNFACCDEFVSLQSIGADDNKVATFLFLKYMVLGRGTSRIVSSLFWALRGPCILWFKTLSYLPLTDSLITTFSGNFTRWQELRVERLLHCNDIDLFGS